MDTQQRAAEFLKVWQEAMAKQLRDGDAWKAMLAAMQQFGAGYDATARSPAAAPDALADAIGAIALRLDAIEQRLAKLDGKRVPRPRPISAKTKKPHRAVARAKPKRVAKPVGKRNKRKR